jgi:hypothetical protein
MSAPKKPSVEILISLNEEPKVNFFPWQIEVCNVAASLCKTISPRGLLSLVLTDTQWNEYPSYTTDAQGNAVINPRTSPPVFLALNDQMSNVAIMVARTTNEQALEWSTIGEEALKAAIEKSLGPVIRQIVKDPKVGFTLMSCLDILTKVRALGTAGCEKRPRTS